MRSLGKIEEAVSLQREALIGFEKLLGDDHQITNRARENLEKCLAELKRFHPKKSEPATKDSL